MKKIANLVAAEMNKIMADPQFGFDKVAAKSKKPVCKCGPDCDCGKDCKCKGGCSKDCSNCSDLGKKSSEDFLGMIINASAELDAMGFEKAAGLLLIASDQLMVEDVNQSMPDADDVLLLDILNVSESDVNQADEDVELNPVSEDELRKMREKKWNEIQRALESAQSEDASDRAKEWQNVFDDAKKSTLEGDDSGQGLPVTDFTKILKDHGFSGEELNRMDVAFADDEEEPEDMEDMEPEDSDEEEDLDFSKEELVELLEECKEKLDELLESPEDIDEDEVMELIECMHEIEDALGGEEDDEEEDEHDHDHKDEESDDDELDSLYLDFED